MSLYVEPVTDLARLFPVRHEDVHGRCLTGNAYYST